MIVLTVTCPRCGEQRDLHKGWARLVPDRIALAALIADFEAHRCPAENRGSQ